MKRSKTVTAVAFLTTLGICLILVFVGMVRVAFGWQKPMALSRYAPGQEGVTYTGLVRWAEDTCRAFCTTELPARETLTELNAAVNKAAGKRIFENTDPEVVLLDNGHFAGLGNFYYYLTQPDNTLEAFRDYAATQLDAPYLYVQAPCKLCVVDDQLPVEGMNNNNTEADWLIRRLEEDGVDSLDLRASLHADGLDHYNCFYVTDHHWTMETGLWAARKMAEELNGRYDLGMDLAALDPGQYTQRKWENAFLGAHGRKVTRTYAQPEDFTLPVPAFDTALTLSVPDEEQTWHGGFEILYDEEKITPEDYYTGNSYGAVLQGDCPYLKVINHNNPDGPVLVVLRESFALAAGPYLALSAGELHLIDARYYNGSVKSLLEEIRPDAVMSLLNVQCQTDTYFDLVR